MASAPLEGPARDTHPEFNSKEGDVVLCSAEGTLYRLPSYILRNTTGLFHAVLPPLQTLEQSAETEVVEPIMLEEKDIVVERILRMISGLATPKWESFDELEAVISLAEKWEAPGPISVIRSAITAPKFLTEPLRLYVVATRFGWEDEARLASTHTLTLSLYEEEYAEQLRRLSANDLMKLLSFHRQRRDEFKAAIDSGELFNDTGHGFCSSCKEIHTFCSVCGWKIDNHGWRELKARMFYEMDQRPLGDKLLGLDIEEWPESVACWKAKCRKVGCGKIFYYNRLTTLRNIRSCLDKLPTTI